MNIYTILRVGLLCARETGNISEADAKLADNWITLQELTCE